MVPLPPPHTSRRFESNPLLHAGQSIINHLGLTARDLANEWEAYVLGRGSDDSSQTMLTLSSLSALEAALSKRSNTATPAAGAGAKVGGRVGQCVYVRPSIHRSGDWMP